MDINALARQLELEADEFYQLIGLFIEVSNADLDKLESGLKKEDTKQIIEAVHSIKGAAINLGFKEISDIAMGIEEGARKENLDGANEAVEIIKEKIDQISASIQEHD